MCRHLGLLKPHAAPRNFVSVEASSNFRLAPSHTRNSVAVETGIACPTHMQYVFVAAVLHGRSASHCLPYHVWHRMVDSHETAWHAVSCLKESHMARARFSELQLFLSSLLGASRMQLCQCQRWVLCFSVSCWICNSVFYGPVAPDSKALAKVAVTNHKLSSVASSC